MPIFTYGCEKLTQHPSSRLSARVRGREARKLLAPLHQTPSLRIALLFVAHARLEGEPARRLTTSLQWPHDFCLVTCRCNQLKKPVFITSLSGTRADPGFFLWGMPLKNGATNWRGKQISKANTKKASSRGRGGEGSPPAASPSFHSCGNDLREKKIISRPQA